MGIKPQDIQRAIAEGNKVLQQLKRVCPKADDPPLTTKKRIRQSSKPVLNQLETEALALLQAACPNTVFHQQAWRVKIANGSWFKVDLCAFLDSRWHAWEVKELRGKNVDRGKLALKCAAHQFPEIIWHLLWRQSGYPWQDQHILP